MQMKILEQFGKVERVENERIQFSQPQLPPHLVCPGQCLLPYWKMLPKKLILLPFFPHEQHLQIFPPPL